MIGTNLAKGLHKNLQRPEMSFLWRNFPGFVSTYTALNSIRLLSYNIRRTRATDTPDQPVHHSNIGVNRQLNGEPGN